MDVTELPFNRLIGLEAEGEESGLLVSLPGDPRYANHLGTVHASALFAVAEAGSGVYLLRHFGTGQGLVPVVRRVEAKFRKPASGRVWARASVDPAELSRWSTELANRGRVLARVQVDVVDSAGTVVLTATVEWFIAREARKDA